jgi:hypothetical protein
LSGRGLGKALGLVLIDKSTKESQAMNAPMPFHGPMNRQFLSIMETEQLPRLLVVHPSFFRRSARNASKIQKNSNRKAWQGRQTDGPDIIPGVQGERGPSGPGPTRDKGPTSIKLAISCFDRSVADLWYSCFSSPQQVVPPSAAARWPPRRSLAKEEQGFWLVVVNPFARPIRPTARPSARRGCARAAPPRTLVRAGTWAPSPAIISKRSQNRRDIRWP